MTIYKEIEIAASKIVENDMHRNNDSISVEDLITRVISDLKTSNFNFCSFNQITLKQKGRNRLVKQYEDQYSTENILCQTIKQILDKTFKIRYPNRNKIVKGLFEIVPAAIKMTEFTIVKFDFQDYFNSISTTYAYNKYIKEHINDRVEEELINNFVEKTKYAYAGLPTSNSIAELLGKKFDLAVRVEFVDSGMIFYQRYIDDSVIIFNERISEDEIKKRLNKLLMKIFHDSSVQCSKKTKTKFNMSKFKYINNILVPNRANNSNAHISFVFLGYEIFLYVENDKIHIKYGISREKMDKYENRINKIVSLFLESGPEDQFRMELLRERLKVFSSRTVYITKHYKRNIWKVKGLISNYGELRNLLDVGLVEPDTEKFLKNIIVDVLEKNGLKDLYFIKQTHKYTQANNNGNKTITYNRYNLYDNMKHNKTILLVDDIGYSYRGLAKLCSKIGIQRETDTKAGSRYGSLVRKYLMAIRLGY